MKKGQLFFLFLMLVYIVYLIFLFFIPSEFVNINRELTYTKLIGSFLNHIPYLKYISLHLINDYVLLAVFSFILGYLYNKKSSGFYIVFIIVSIALYFIVLKVNRVFGLNYPEKELFSVYLTTFSFLHFSQKDKINIISFVFMLLSLFFSFFSQKIPISGILLSFLFGLSIGKTLLKTEKYLF